MHTALIALLALLLAHLMAASDVDNSKIRTAEHHLEHGRRGPALAALHGCSGPRALALAMRLFRHDPGDLSPALMAAFAFQNPEAVAKALVPLLDDPDWQASMPAARLLAASGAPSARAHLLTRAKVRDDRVRWAVWEGLAALPPPRDVTTLLAAIDAQLKDPHLGVRWAVARVLISIASDPRARPLLVAAACAETEDIARAAGLALGRHKLAAPPPELLQALNGKELGAAQGAAAALGAFGPSAAAALHKACLNHAAWQVRAAAVEALASGPTDDALLAALADADWAVRATAAEVLAQRGCAAAVAPLTDRLAVATGSEREAVLLALRGLSGRQDITDIAGVQRWMAEAGPSPTVRRLTLDRYPPSTGSDYPTGVASVLLVIDTSGSMGEYSASRGASPPKKRDLVRDDVLRLVRGLTPATRFNALFFALKVERMSPGPLPATWRVKALFERQLEGLHSRGATDLIRILREALLQPDGDLLRIYTDGMPTAGETADPRQILADIAGLNRLRSRPATIQVLTFANDPPKGFLEQLAVQSGGSYRRLP